MSALATSRASGAATEPSAHRSTGDAFLPVQPNAERPVMFGSDGERLFGMVHAAHGSTGVVIIVGGPQYRAGSHRHFVQLARALAACAYPTLRFDVRGMGDSTGTICSFEQVPPDIGAAVGALLAHQPQVQRVVLWGLCDGASAALLYLHEHPDSRVAGLCLVNPWVRSAAGLARTHVKHYYRKRLMQRDFWRKLISGRVARSALTGLANNLRAMQRTPKTPADAATSSYQHRMAEGWRHHGGPTLLMLSGNDYTAREFEEFVANGTDWPILIRRDGVQIARLAGADHTLSHRAHALEAQAVLLDWLAATWPGGQASADGR